MPPRVACRVHWLPAQTHAGENIGITGTHVLFVELKSWGPAPGKHQPRTGSAHTRPIQWGGRRAP
jgi:hypothetical protein